MKRCFGLVIAMAVFCLAGSTFGQGGVPARAAAFATTPDIPYEAVPNFFKIPDGLYLGEVLGVATDSKGHVFLYTRGNHTRLFEFEKDGKFMREIGDNLYAFEMAHGVRVDKNDNIWAVDEGTNMIVEFNQLGRVIFTLGSKPDSGKGWAFQTPKFNDPVPPAQPYIFNRPTDIAWDPQGNFFIADGYGNSRVAKYDKNGTFIKSVGEKGKAPGQLNLPHAIAADAAGNVYVGDRSNSRVQIFDDDLNLKKVVDNVGAPWAMCISGGPHQYLYVSNSNPDNNDSRMIAVSGEIYKMELDGTVIGKFGKPGKLPGEFATVHSLDCRNENEIYTAEITAWRAQKIILHPEKMAAGSKAGN
jgi:DNA-binding beta-propeller fold protein YncE